MCRLSQKERQRESDKEDYEESVFPLGVSVPVAVFPALVMTSHVL